MQNFSGIAIIVCLILLVVGVIIGWALGSRTQKQRVIQERKGAIQQSRSVILGEVYEQMYPMISNCPYSPRDMVFVGRGVDYIVFDGLSEGNLKNIVFLELKTGKSRQNKNEQHIQACVSENRVHYKVVRL